LALENPRLFHDLLFTASTQTLLEIAADARHPGAELGVIAVAAEPDEPFSAQRNTISVVRFLNGNEETSVRRD
jgi:hypothetical protein